MLTKCDGCNKDFECSTRKFNYNKKSGLKIFCSTECYYQYKREKTSIKTDCANCGKKIIKPKSSLNKSLTGNLYCSRSCSATKNNSLFKKWKNHPNYKDGISAYRKIKFDSVKKIECEICKFDNILALEIHHKDRNRNNNDLNNLQVLCCNCHKIEHRLKTQKTFSQNNSPTNQTIMYKSLH